MATGPGPTPTYQKRYVDSINGQNLPGWGLTAQNPWLTIQYSVSMLSQLNLTDISPGMLILVDKGPFTENVSMKGKQYSYITVTRETPHYTKPQGDYAWGPFCEERPTIDGNAADSVFTIEDAVGVVLQDLEIVNGKAHRGAGVHATRSQVDLIRCCIETNHATTGGGFVHTASGGGFAYDHCDTGKPSKIEACVVYKNTAGQEGGGGWIFETTSKVKITKTLFHDNTADDGFGGGLAVHNCTDVEILEHCVFGGGPQPYRNRAKRGGAVYVTHHQGTLKIGDPSAGPGSPDRNKMTYNVAKEWGGAVAIVTQSKGVTIAGTDIVMNDANSGSTTRPTGYGAGISIVQFDPPDRPTPQQIDDCLVELTNNHIHLNTAASDGGGIYARRGSKTKIVNNDIESNTALRTRGFGGGVCVMALSDITMKDSKIESNRASQGEGGGLFASDSNVELTDVQVGGNFALEDGGGACISAGVVVADALFVSAVMQGMARPRFRATIKGTAASSATIDGNVNNFGRGGGLYVEETWNAAWDLDVNLDTVSVLNNRAGVNCGGGLSCYRVKRLAVSGCLFSDNSALTRGGGLEVGFIKDASVAKSSILKNQARMGGGVSFVGCDIDTSTVTGNLFQDNKAPGGGIDILLLTCNVQNVTRQDIADANNSDTATPPHHVPPANVEAR